MTTVADVIRSKTGGSDPLSFPTGFSDAIAGISGGDGVSLDIDLLAPFLSSFFNVVNGSSWTTTQPTTAKPISLTSDNFQYLTDLMGVPSNWYYVKYLGDRVSNYRSLLAGGPQIYSSIDLNRNILRYDCFLAGVKTYGYIRDYTASENEIYVKEMVEGHVRITNNQADGYFRLPYSLFANATLNEFPELVDSEVAATNLFMDDYCFAYTSFHVDTIDLSKYTVHSSEFVFSNAKSITYSVDDNGKVSSPTYGPITVILGNTTSTYISGYMFGNPSYPTIIKMTLASPPPIPSNYFQSTGIAKIIVPAGSLSTYQEATNWANYADLMEEATE